VNGESISGLTGARVAVWRLCNGGEEVAVKGPGAGNTWVRREEMKNGERCGGERWGSPFI
jgi:hypothetical protein